MPRPSISHIATQLATARRAKKLSQQALGRKTGLPQSHISKIERGKVDVGLATLIQMLRVLDLEIMLIPRQLVPAVQSIQRTGGSTRAAESEQERPPHRLGEAEDES